MIETQSHVSPIDQERGGSGRLASPARLIGPGIMIVAVTYGLARYSFGLFLPEFQQTYGLSHEWLGLIASASYGGFILAALYASWVSGLRGPRLPVVLGGVSATLGMLIISVSDTVWGLALGVVIAGASPGFSYPPLSDAVMRMIQAKDQNRTYTIINSGTSFGVIVAGPLALFAGAEWRLAWFGFAVIALVAAVWNARIMPTGAFRGNAHEIPKIRLAWLVKPRSRSLLAAALLLGLSTSVYWTYAVELIVDGGSFGTVAATAAVNAETGTRFFWVLIGLSGIAGAFTGEAVSAVGLRRVLTLVLLGIAGALALLAVAPHNAFAVGASAALFGATFISATALLGVWSVRVFHDRPSAGFGATFLVITGGQMISPTLAGWLIGGIGLQMVFWIAVAIALATAFLAPKEHIDSMLEPVEAEDLDGRVVDFPIVKDGADAEAEANAAWPAVPAIMRQRKKGVSIGR